MKIKKLKLKNIRSYENQEIIFPEGSLLLAGEVGSGKTSLLLAIEYALFGLQPGQVGSALLRNDSSLGEVTMEFEVDGNEIIIERKLKRGKTITNDYAAATINGEKIECSVTELKTKVLNLINYPVEFLKKNNLLYKYTVYTPQEQMKQIILEDPENRLNILRLIFGVDKYKRIRENLEILLTKMREDGKILQGEINSLGEDKNRLESTRSFTVVIEKKIEEQMKLLQEDILKRNKSEEELVDTEKKIKEKEKLETEIEKAKVILLTKRENLRDNEREYQELERNFIHEVKDFKDSEFDKVIEDLAIKRDLIDKLQEKYIESIGELNSLNQRKKDRLENKERIFKIDICPTCLQNVSEVHKHNVVNKMETATVEINKLISEFEIGKKELFLQMEKGKKEMQELEGKKVELEILKSKIPEVERAKKKLKDLTKNKSILLKDIDLISKHIDDLKAGIAGFSRVNVNYKIKQEDLRKIVKVEKDSEIALAEMKKELELTFKEIKHLEIQIKRKEEQKSKLAELLEIGDWLSKDFISLVEFTERNVMLKLRIEFSKVFSKWFHLLVHDSFEIQLDENFTPVILQGNIEMDYSFLSGGERTAVALAYRLALNQTINSVLSNIKTRDIVILDEPTEGFSEVQIDKIREILLELKVKQLIIVSHEQKIEGFVDNILRVKKEGDSSFVEYSNLNSLAGF